MEILNMSNGHLINVFSQAVKSNMGAEVSNLRFVGGGSYGKVFKGTLPDGRVIALKAYREQGKNLKEAASLKMLAANARVKMPEVYFTHSDESSAVMCMSFIEGSNVLNPKFLLKSKSQKQAFTDEVITGLLDLHSVTGEKYGDLANPTHTSWLDFYREMMIEPKLAGLNELCRNGKYSRKNYELLCEATEIFYKVAGEPEKPVLIHADINIMNIMADPKTMKLTGFIDPGDTVWADREFDLFQLRNMWGDSFGLYETYKARCKTSEHCDFKVAYYGALNEASCRLGGALIFPLWEILCNNRLKKEMKKY